MSHADRRVKFKGKIMYRYYHLLLEDVHDFAQTLACRLCCSGFSDLLIRV